MGKSRACTGKKAFKYRRQADDFAWSLRRKFLDTASPYKCKHCGAWHVGHARGLQRFR